MCNNYASKVPATKIAEAFSDTGLGLKFEGSSVPNLEPRDDIRIGDSAPIVARQGENVILREARWAWKAPSGKPVFNFRSEGRSFTQSDRCLIPADAFYEFTAAEPGQKRKTKWRFTARSADWFWIAGIVKDSAFAMLTTEPGPDISPYHDRQIVILPRSLGVCWLTLSRPERDLLKPAASGTLQVEKVFP